jgi:hypothetical protein
MKKAKWPEEFPNWMRWVLLIIFGSLAIYLIINGVQLSRGHQNFPYKLR